MSAVAVEIMSRPAFIRPEADTSRVSTPVVVTVADLDDVMDSVKCSCNAGDDNPH